MKRKLALIFNLGSSSIKLEIFDVSTLESLLKINQSSQNTSIDLNRLIQKISKDFPIQDFILTGHRVVHGGPNLGNCHEISPTIIQEITRNSQKAPIHNPLNLIGITAALKTFKNSLHYACFDTGFFRNIPNYIQTLAIPKEWCEKYEFQKYGFHGIDHQYIAELYPNSKKLVICHLGSGSSICLVENQKAIDITMSYSPISGLIMSSRSGDVDPNLICELYENKEKNIVHKLNFESGLLALSLDTPSLKEIYQHKDQNPNYQLAYNAFIYETSKKIAGFIGQSPKADKLIFTGGISENNPHIIQDILEKLNKECYTEYKIQASNENLQILKNIIKNHAS